MLGIGSRVGRAAAHHRRAAAIVAAAEAALGGHVPASRTAEQHHALRELARRLASTAVALAPGWLGAPLDIAPAAAPPLPAAAGRPDPPAFIRVGTARPLADVEFPVVVPSARVALDLDASEDQRVAGLLQSVLLRLLASSPPGTLSVRVVDPAGVVAGPFDQLCRAGIMAPPVTDRRSLATLLNVAEQRGPDRNLLLIVAGWPAGTEPATIDRLAALSAASRGLHLLVAGWPPVGTTPGRPLPGATQVTLDAPSVLVGHPPGGSFATGVPPGVEPSAGLNADVLLDQAPPPALVRRVCARVASQVTARPRSALGAPAPRRTRPDSPSATPLVLEVGRAKDTPVTLSLGGATWHWLIGGGPGSGKSTLLRHLVHQLASRYDPDEVALHLLDPGGSPALARLADTVPHVRATALGGVNRVRAGLHEVAANAARQRRPHRVVCLLDHLDDLRDEPTYALLSSLAKSGPARGVHLVLAGRGEPPSELAVHCRVRIALPGAHVLDVANDAAARLATGTAVVNTASGLGGPRGVTRAHEHVVHLPIPPADSGRLRPTQADSRRAHERSNKGG